MATEVTRLHEEQRSGEGQRIMFWSNTHRPQDFVGSARFVPKLKRDIVIKALRGGRNLDAYMGWAECRICGVKLGSSDLGTDGFVWPEKAEHYVTEHDVWVPGLDALYDAVMGRLR